MKAPDFTLLDQDGKVHKLSDYKGKWVVLYFYPRDNTTGCTKEACGFRDELKSFKNKRVVVLGVSKDSVASHKKFAHKYRLNFPILSDEEKKVLKAYKAWGLKKFLGRIFEGTFRNTYLISPKGEIKKTYEKVNPLTHPSQILQDLQLLQ